MSDIEEWVLRNGSFDVNEEDSNAFLLDGQYCISRNTFINKEYITEIKNLYE